MKYVTEFRDPKKAQGVMRHIEQLTRELGATPEQPVRLMEVCGGHTHTIFKFGLEELLPEGIDLIHGPGCPVCVLPMSRVDDCVAIAAREDVILTTFGDAMRVPGSRMSLLQAKAAGHDIRMVYSPLDALQLARDNPDRNVVFFGLGFETTMPSTAFTVLQARDEGIGNFFLFCNHITILPTLRAILEDNDLRLDGFIGPGHVSMIIGTEGYDFIASKHGKPLVVAGFEPLDILQSVSMLLQQLRDQRSVVENQYTRVVPPHGNAAALAAMEQVFRAREQFEWRGLGSIPESGVEMQEEFAAFDAEKVFALPDLPVVDPAECQCGDVLKGRLKPWQCRVFGKACTPDQPLGALMVSSEGACAAYYHYGSQWRERVEEATA
jgi:hydrogenase expression/formation protein HypD